jgi:lipopolysaccharide biosynthesis glycosyltransferase
MTKEIPVMFSFDNNYVIPAAVAFYSMLEHANRKFHYKLYVLHSDISIDNQSKLKETIKRFSRFSSLEFIDMANKLEDIWQTIKVKGHFSKETASKVLASSFFPQYDKIVTSDVDVVFLGDISESYINFNVNEDYYLAGVKPVGKVLGYMDNYQSDFTDKEIKKLSSFCGGYIVFNLKKLREDKMEQKFIKCFKDNAHRLNQMEQDVLTLTCSPNIKYLPLNYVTCSYVWDYYTQDQDFDNDINFSRQELKDAMSHPIQLHYATSIKPWKNVDSTKSEEWFKYVVKTPFLNSFLKQLPEKIVIVPKENIRELIKLTKIVGKKYLKRIRRLVLRVVRNPLAIFKLSTYIKILGKISSSRKTGLLILDDCFPSPRSSFRYCEFLTYLRHFHHSKAVLTNGVGIETDLLNKINDRQTVEEFIKQQRLLTGRVTTDPDQRGAKLAIAVFLNNIYSNLPYLESNGIPFVFTLYPGGGFALKDAISDKKLKEVLSSKMFRKVIVTQEVTRHYLINKKFCSEDKIEYIFGGIVSELFLKTKTNKKRFYGVDKKHFDICFVAHKYSPRGIDKGYDLFIQLAQMMVENHKNVRFHVIGEFSEKDIDVTRIKDRIKFYGIRDPMWLMKFYESQDVIISPTKPFVLSKGSFDGFPTTCSLEAMSRGVVAFCTDELRSNPGFVDGQDMVIIKHDVKDVYKKVSSYYDYPNRLIEVSKSGIAAVRRLYSFESQLTPRIMLVKSVLRSIKKGQ